MRPTGRTASAASAKNVFHVPVLCEQAESLWLTDPNGVYVDATVGGGGHAEYLLQRLGPRGRLIGIDRDSDAYSHSFQRLRCYTEKTSLHAANFVDLLTIIKKENIMKVHGILADLGVSSYQLNTPLRGFSYRSDGPLDMRMHQADPFSAREFLNACSVDELIHVFQTYGEERYSRRIAKKIIESRKKAPISTTRELAELIRQCVPGRFAVKSLSRIFQALRIAVNQEINNLLEFLSFVPQLLLPGGRWVMIAYHSLEDRPIKQAFRFYTKGGELPQGIQPDASVWGKTFTALTKRPIRSDESEIARNPRARSARLRAIEKR